MTIYMFSKEDSKDITTFEDVEEVALTLGVPKFKVQRVLDGYAGSLNGYGFLEKPPTTKGFDSSKVSYHQEQKNRVFDATQELGTWEECVWLSKGNTEIPRKSTKIAKAIQMLNNGYIAIPF